MPHLVAKVPLDALCRFLQEHGEYWMTDGLSDDEGNPQSPSELVDALACVRPELGYVYIFNPEEPPDEAVNNLDWQSIPTIAASELHSFIIKTVRGSDFFWIAPSDEHLSNGDYVTILPVEPLIEEQNPRPEEYPAPASPRLTKVSIANFKGVRDPVEFALKPITLLFGANSAGKSSIIHAFHYAREIFERRNLNADRTLSGENTLDLGGFTTFIHGHDRQSQFRLGFDLDLNDVSLPNFAGAIPIGAPTEEPSSLYRNVLSARIEVTVAWSDLLGAAYVPRFAVVLNDQPFAEITSQPGSPDVLLSLDSRHPVFVRARENSTIWSWHPLEPDDWDETDSAFHALLSWVLHSQAIVGIGPAQPPYTDTLGLAGLSDALPHFSQRLQFAGDWDWSERRRDLDPSDLPTMVDLIADTLSELILGPGQLVRSLLSEMRYIGPLRQVPTRNYYRPRFQETSRWVDGTAAWNLLLEGDTELVSRVQAWISDSDKLNIGYRVEPKFFKEFSRDQMTRLETLTRRLVDDADVNALRQLLLEDLAEPAWSTRLVLYDTANDVEVEPQDVGVGISQLVPVVVAALDRHQGLTAIEQPELHLHPAVQVALGDLLIAGARIVPRLLLIETHSEHLLLRMLRRIRETHEGELPSDHSGLHPDEIAVIYVETEEGRVRISPLRIDETGEFRDRWPKGFYEERAAELF